MKTIIANIFLFILPFSAYSQESLPFEEKSKYEKFLAQKTEEVILKILGPNQAKVSVEVEMDFTKTETVKYEKEQENPAQFAFQNQAGDISGMEYLMPGFGFPMSQKDDKNKSYMKQFVFPSNFIKKIKATIMINSSLSDVDAENIKKIVSEILNLKQERNDEIVLVKANFAPIWKTIWYNQESLNFIMKYIIISILAIISLIIVAIGFLKLASAMNTMAQVQQSHQITMEMGGGVNQALPAIQENILGIKEEKKQKEEEKKEDKIYFQILPHQLDALALLMSKEDPENVAIVADHLREDIKNEFLKKLPLEFAAKVLAALSKIRFIEQELIYNLKDELETRLSGAVGGVENAVKSFASLTYEQKESLAEKLKSEDPVLYEEMRKRFVFWEDIYSLKDNEISLLFTALSYDDISQVLKIFSEDFKEKIKKEFSDTAWKIISEKSEYVLEENIKKSKEKIVNTLANMIEEGRIKHPYVNKDFLLTKES